MVFLLLVCDETRVRNPTAATFIRIRCGHSFGFITQYGCNSLSLFNTTAANDANAMLVHYQLCNDDLCLGLLLISMCPGLVALDEPYPSKSARELAGQLYLPARLHRLESSPAYVAWRQVRLEP